MSTDPSKTRSHCENDKCRPNGNRWRDSLTETGQTLPGYDQLLPALCAQLLCHWTPEIEQAFQNLRSSLVETVVLAHPDFACPFMLITDAFLDGICAVLSQIKEEEAKASITFASKSIF